MKRDDVDGNAQGKAPHLEGPNPSPGDLAGDHAGGGRGGAGVDPSADAPRPAGPAPGLEAGGAIDVSALPGASAWLHDVQASTAGVGAAQLQGFTTDVGPADGGPQVRVRGAALSPLPGGGPHGALVRRAEDELFTRAGGLPPAGAGPGGPAADGEASAREAEVDRLFSGGVFDGLD